MEGFGEATRAWFDAAFAAPTPVQRDGWSRISSGDHTLLLAPTGSGKTLAAFLWCIDRLTRLPAETGPGVRVLYISPLKALVYDIERNLRAPLVGIEAAARVDGRGGPIRVPRIAMRTGDTSQRERRQQARSPAEILVTTPESLYLLLTSQARETLRTVDTIIIDEIHALAGTKRGSHLALSLERLCRITLQEPQRIGLSATVRPIDSVARYLGGDRPVVPVDASAVPVLDLEIVVPVPDMTRPATAAGSGGNLLLAPDDPETRASIWPAVHARLLALIREHRTTIIFVNSRGGCERLAQSLNELAGEEIVLAHHGSIAHEQRKQIEETLKAGELPALVATSSLELGIDMGTVDLVVLVESPGSVSSGLQRVGRAGHGVGEVSIGRIFPKHRADLLEAAVVAGRMHQGLLEPIRIPRQPLDILAQQIVAMCAMGDWPLDDLERLLRRSAPFAELGRDTLTAVLDMLAGRYPSAEFAELRARVVWDRETDVLSARRGAQHLAVVSGGTIPDRGLYRVQLGADGPRVGELDEEMVHETRVGQIVLLGASSWRVEEITRDRVIVSPAPGQPGRLPFWHGEGPGRPVELGEAMGAFVRELDAVDGDARSGWLREHHHLDELAARNLIAFVDEQREMTGTLPTDRAITVERFRDELGDWRVCVLTPFGGRVNAPWALAIEARLAGAAGHDVQTLYSDDGIVLRFVDADEPPGLELLLPEPEEVEELLFEQLAHSALFASQFRENAARALLLPRRRPGERTPLWAQRLRSQNLLAVARNYPAFPMILETYRACLQDIFDLPALERILGRIQRREIRVDLVETPTASPFARSLVFQWVATHLYDGDAPLAERKAHALTLDRHLLRELLGHEDLRQLLDAEVMAELETQLQYTAEDRRVRHVDNLHDLLRRIGDLTVEEVRERITDPQDAESWLETLERTRRAVRLRIAGEARWAAIEDVAMLRDAVGVVPPPGLPDVFLEGVPDPLQQLIARFARTHGPFTTMNVAARFGLPPGAVEPTLRELAARRSVQEGEFRPGAEGAEWIDHEILRRLRRRTLARLRDEVAPVEAATLARFLPAWHGVGETRRGPARLEETLDQLEGLPLSFKELEGVILPARVSDFQPRMLDDLGATGLFVWVGHGALGATDGRVALYRRERVGLLLDPPGAEALEHATPVHETLLTHLAERGASFFVELQLAVSDGTPGNEVRDALWDLVWAGLITNDTFLPLRAAQAPRKRRKAVEARRGRGRGAGRTATPDRALGGRWSLVSNLIGVRSPPPTERAHARALSLLERHGVVTREVAGLEALPGGFTATYRVLRAMEESGRVRRGYFVEGLGGAQFAWPGAVDRLRSVRAGGDSSPVVALSAIDPANPYGWLLKWPATRDDAGGQPRRVAGATVVLVDGVPVLYLDKGGRRLLTFAAVEDRPTAIKALRALRTVAARSRGRELRIERIDGEIARSSRLAATLREADFSADHKGLTLDAATS